MTKPKNYIAQLIGEDFLGKSKKINSYFLRIDLATEHRRILGQDDKVLQLIKSTHDSALADDNQLRNALQNVGIKV